MLLLTAVMWAEACTSLPDDEPGWCPEVLVQDTVACVFEAIDAWPVGSKDEVLSFGERQRRLADAGTVLPMRFGTVVTDEASLRRLLLERGPSWAARLEYLEGCVELIVHTVPTAAQPPAREDSHRSGRAYLEGLAASHRTARASNRQVMALLDPYCRELRELTTKEGTRTACLVPAGSVELLRAETERWATEEGLLAVVTGPFPALTFAEPSPR